MLDEHGSEASASGSTASPRSLGGATQATSNKLIHNTAFKNINKKVNKRGKQKNAQIIARSLVLAGFNPDGAKSKLTSIKKLIRETMQK